MSTTSSPRGSSTNCPRRCGATSSSILEVVDEEKWPYATSYARSRFLLTIQLNDNDPEAVGAAFFELGLVPDLTLFEDHTRIRTRTGMNVRQMRILADSDRSERQRVLELGLTDANFRSQLTAFTAQHGLGEPREWTRRIVIDRVNWPLSFHHWPLRDTAETEQVHVTIGELGLPLAGDQPEHANHPLLSNLAGQPVLVAGPKGANQLPVNFSVDARPSAYPGTCPIHRADRLRGIRSHRSCGLGQGDGERPRLAKDHLPEAARCRAGTGLALCPAATAGRRGNRAPGRAS